MTFDPALVKKVARAIVQARDTTHEPQEWEVIAALGEATAALEASGLDAVVAALERVESDCKLAVEALGKSASVERSFRIIEGRFRIIGARARSALANHRR